ncbi:hypothetical protein Hanom_Chr05g00417341 [Helianthus anomalus]
MRDLGIDPEEKTKKAPVKKKAPTRKKVTIDTGAASKKTGGSHATAAVPEKGLSRIGEKKKSSASASKSSGSAGSRAPDFGATPSSLHEEEEEEEEEVEEQGARLVTRKRSRKETTDGDTPPVQKAVTTQLIGKQGRLWSLYKFSPEALKKAAENVKGPELKKAKEPEPKKTKFVIVPPKMTPEKEAEKTVEEPAGDVVPEKEGPEVVHITGLDQPLKGKGPEVSAPSAAVQHDAPTQTAQVLSVVGGSAANVQAQVAHGDASSTAAGTGAGGSGAASQKGDGKKIPRQRSPIGVEDTLGGIYCKTYTEEQRGEEKHVPV